MELFYSFSFDHKIYKLTGHCDGKNRLTLGGNGGGREGSWGICLNKELINHFHQKDCIVYSFGIQTDWSFDAAIAQLGCEVRCFQLKMLFLDCFGLF